jgi:predicted molibdopterin-dependent oxidoreductase YjgC
MGCEMELKLHKDRILSAKPSEEGAVNQSQACVKGRFLIKDVVYSPRRILRPMIRRNKELEEVSWEEAVDFVMQKIKTYKGNETGMIMSPQLSCEDSFIANKFAQDVMKTKNVGLATAYTPLDSLWHLAQKNGISPALQFKKEDISQAKVIMIAGTDLAISHPMLWLEVLKAVRKGAKLVMASPYELVGSRYASLWLQIKPGSEDLLFMCLSKLIENNETAKVNNFEGYESFRKSLDKPDLSKAQEDIGIDEQMLHRAADLLLQEKPCFIAGIGLTPFSGENRNIAALWNLSLQSRGQLIPLGLENNSRGLFELYRNSYPKKKSVSQIIQDTNEGHIKALYMIGSIPLDKKPKAEFLVVQDCYLSDAAERADAVFPAVTFAEADGTFVNTEGRIQLFPAVIQPVAEARPDWWILSQLAKKLGKRDFDFKKSEEIRKVLKSSISGFARIRLSSTRGGKAPFVKNGVKGTPKFLSLKSRDSSPTIEKKFPFILCLDYCLDTYRSFILSREIKAFGILRDERWIKINPNDARTLKLKNGDAVIVESAVGKRKGVVKISETVPRGVLRADFLWSEGAEESCCPIPVRAKRGK